MVTLVAHSQECLFLRSINSFAFFRFAQENESRKREIVGFKRSLKRGDFQICEKETSAIMTV